MSSTHASGEAPQTPFVGEPSGLSGLAPSAILSQTQTGQALDRFLLGVPVDTGSGWLPDPRSETGLAAAEASRDYSPYLIGGHAWTLGRGTAVTRSASTPARTTLPTPSRRQQRRNRTLAVLVDQLVGLARIKPVLSASFAPTPDGVYVWSTSEQLASGFE